MGQVNLFGQFYWTMVLPYALSCAVLCAVDLFVPDLLSAFLDAALVVAAFGAITTNLLSSIGGHLVTLGNAAEHEFVLKMGRKAGVERFLLGFRMVSRKPQWVMDEPWGKIGSQKGHGMHREYGFMETRSGRWSTGGGERRPFMIEWDG